MGCTYMYLHVMFVPSLYDFEIKKQKIMLCVYNIL